VTGREVVLLWGLPADPPIAAIRRSLQRTGCPVILLDQGKVLDTEVELTVTDRVEGVLHLGDERLDLAMVKAVYLRPYDARQLPCVIDAEQDGAALNHAALVQDMMLSWSELTPALVLNRPTHMAANNSKPYQALWIESLGFNIPRTLLTTDPAAAFEFWRRHGTVVYKSVSGIRSIVSCVTEEHATRFENIASCPTQFQEYIAGREYRAHVVGESVFACEIVSSADDYRYTAESVDMRPCELSDEIATRCRALARSMRLSVAGIDLRCTPEGHWYCLEVNSSPGFTYFERLTGQPIAEAIAELLVSAHPTRSTAAEGAKPIPGPRLRRRKSAEIRGRSTRRGG
jgi:RimK-like ATP-grasp domain